MKGSGEWPVKLYVLPFLKGCYCLHCFIACRRVMVRKKNASFEDLFLGSHLPSKSVSSYLSNKSVASTLTTILP